MPFGVRQVGVAGSRLMGKRGARKGHRYTVRAASAIWRPARAVRPIRRTSRRLGNKPASPIWITHLAVHSRLSKGRVAHPPGIDKRWANGCSARSHYPLKHVPHIAMDNMGISRRGVFLGLNGTLVEPVKPERLDALTLIPGVVTAVARLSAAGFICPVVTVQSRIAKELFSLAEFAIWFARFAASLEAQGARIVGPYVCPHRFAEPCWCKKPNTLLYERAAAEHLHG